MKKSYNEVLEDWSSLCFTELKGNTWSTIPQLKGIEFLNLEIKDVNLGSKEIQEVDLNFTYDKIRKREYE